MILLKENAGKGYDMNSCYDINEMLNDCDDALYRWYNVFMDGEKGCRRRCFDGLFNMSHVCRMRRIWFVEGEKTYGTSYSVYFSLTKKRKLHIIDKDKTYFF